MIFRDRAEAGARLGAHLRARLAEREADVVVLGIPRGGVVVAAPVAAALEATLDVTVPRKLGAPDNPELAIGALAVVDGEDIVVLNERTIEYLRVPREHVERTVRAERAEIARRLREYRGTRAAPALAGRWVVIVDDGLATGLTAQAAAAAVARQKPRRVTVAVPVAPASAIREFAARGVVLEALATPTPFEAVGRFYESFAPVEDDEVRALLRLAD
ncbi:MAG TPA: phosphoribosyltransferase family protein [Vicinamibacteria bacterium]|nr:phosphoribosyltransferase family protein [Vicinamibacteria bacterium]